MVEGLVEGPVNFQCDDVNKAGRKQAATEDLGVVGFLSRLSYLDKVGKVPGIT